MIISTASALPFSAKAVENYSLWIGGVQVTSENAGNIFAGDVVNDGKASYNHATKTLTLNGADISSGVQKTLYFSNRDWDKYYTNLIYAEDLGDLTIKVTSDTVLHRAHTDSWTSPQGIALFDNNGANLTIDLQNGAKLDFNISTTAQKAVYVSAISLSGYNLAIKGNGKITTDILSHDSQVHAFGIRFLDDAQHSLSIDESAAVDIKANHSTMFSASGIQANSAENKLALSVGENASLKIVSCAGLTNINATVSGYMEIEPNSYFSTASKPALSSSSVTAGEGKAVFAGKDADSAAYKANPWSGYSVATENNCYLVVKAPQLYSVNVTAGENMTKTSGSESQSVVQGAEIEYVVYTADSGYCFPSSYAVTPINGIYVERNTAKELIVYGTPTADADITLPAPSQHPSTYSDYENYYYSSCEESGHYDELRYCSNCYELVSSETIYQDALGHDWGEWYKTSAPSCTESGEEQRVCSRDTSHIETRTINPLGHDWGEWEQTKNPSCTEKGQEQRVCNTNSNHIEIRDIDALGHDFGENEKVCGRCGVDNPNYIAPEDAALPTEEKTEEIIKKTNTDKKDVSGSVYKRLMLKATPKKQTITITWKQIKGADGYIIYGAPCGQEMKRIATIKNAKTTKKTFKKLKKGKYYKYMVVAYKTTADGNRIITKSKTAHCCTDGGKKGNPTSLSVKKAKLTVKKGKTVKINPTLKSKKKVDTHIAKFRYESSNTKIATVDKNGKVKGKKKGTATIYVYAQDGKCKTVKIKVK